MDHALALADRARPPDLRCPPAQVRSVFLERSLPVFSCMSTMFFRASLAALPLVLLAACSQNPPPPDVAPEVIPEPVTNVRIATAEQPVAPGDCAEAMRRALA